MGKYNPIFILILKENILPEHCLKIIAAINPKISLYFPAIIFNEDMRIIAMSFFLYRIEANIRDSGIHKINEVKKIIILIKNLVRKCLTYHRKSYILKEFFFIIYNYCVSIIGKLTL